MNILNHTAKTVASRVGSMEPECYDLDGYTTGRIETLEKVVKKCEEAFIMLIYDIPSSLTKECPNPSKLLWRHGFRLNLSCWVLPKSQLTHPSIVKLLGRWSEYNIETHAIEYAESQREKIKAIAVAKLEEEELRRQHTALIANIASADEALREALDVGPVTMRQVELSEAYRDNRVRASLRTASELLEAALCCATLYDEEMKTADLIEGVKLAIKSRKEVFNAEMMRKGSKGVA